MAICIALITVLLVWFPNTYELEDVRFLDLLSDKSQLAGLVANKTCVRSVTGRFISALWFQSNGVLYSQDAGSIDTGTWYVEDQLVLLKLKDGYRFRALPMLCQRIRGALNVDVDPIYCKIIPTGSKEEIGCQKMSDGDTLNISKNNRMR